MARKTEYYVVVKKEGEKEGREVGAIHNHKIIRVPLEFVGRGLELLLSEKIAQVLAEKIQSFDGIASVHVKKRPDGSLTPPKEVVIK